MFAIDRSSPIALFKQIEAALRQQIAQRVLPGGTRLPSIRQLATQLSVSTNTVVVAYDRLVAAGVIDTHGTAGFFVCAPADTSRAIPDEVALEAGQEQEPVWLIQQVNDPVAKYLPEGTVLPRDGARQITLADLATHTAGLPLRPDNLAPKDPDTK